MYAAGLVFLLLVLLVYALGTVLFVMARRERGQRLFTPAELVLLVVVAGRRRRPASSACLDQPDRPPPLTHGRTP